jgi:hypothetical protein
MLERSSFVVSSLHLISNATSATFADMGSLWLKLPTPASLRACFPPETLTLFTRHGLGFRVWAGLVAYTYGNRLTEGFFVF